MHSRNLEKKRGNPQGVGIATAAMEAEVTIMGRHRALMEENMAPAGGTVGAQSTKGRGGVEKRTIKLIYVSYL